MLKVCIYAKWHLRRRRPARLLPLRPPFKLPLLGELRLLISGHPELESEL